MNTLTLSNYQKRNLLAKSHDSFAPQYVISQEERIKQQLRYLGVSRTAMHSEEARYLKQIIHGDEYIQGVVFGKAPEGFAMLLITDKRVIFLDRKPLFVNQDDIKFDVVSGINVSHVGFGTNVILHTRIRDYSMRTMNSKCAKNFAYAVERHCLEHRNKEV